MRQVRAAFPLTMPEGVHRVVSMDELVGTWEPGQRLLAQVQGPRDVDLVRRLTEAGLGNVGAVESSELMSGDVVAASGCGGRVAVLHREGDTHHTLFLTNRCNSNCLMCSQPPTPHDDSWLVDEALETVRHVRVAPRVVGITGGEPLLARVGLRRLIDSISQRFPSTSIEVLSNGRLLSDERVRREVLAGLNSRVTWLVPLYGHADFVHDFVVQAPGAFEETLEGLLVLRAHEQQVQLRVVLIEPVLRVLRELCEFIGRNLPFVREVALMGCEPTGFALANRDQCEVDIAQWSATLTEASRVLSRFRIPHLFMNMPLCVLPRNLWPAASRSISDWKNVFVDECDQCAVKKECCGLFAWHERGWKPSTLRPIEKVQA